MWATGHYRNGVLLTPVTADLVVAELAGEPVDHAFGPERFAAPGGSNVGLPRQGVVGPTFDSARGCAVIVLNGEPRERDGATIVELLADLGVEERARGVAVAVNGEIVPRAHWPSHRVDTGDRVEALSAMQGG